MVAVFFFFSRIQNAKLIWPFPGGLDLGICVFLPASHVGFQLGKTAMPFCLSVDSDNP